MISTRSFLTLVTFATILIIKPTVAHPEVYESSGNNVSERRGISHRFGPSEQMCGITWANEAIRTEFQKMTTPPAFFCRNSGGFSYRCNSCGLVSSPDPIGPIDRRGMTTMSGKVYACTAKNAQGIATQVGDSTCIAYSIPDGRAGTIHCLSPTFEFLECLIDQTVGHFDPISCTGCLLYQTDENDRGGIFRHQLP